VRNIWLPGERPRVRIRPYACQHVAVLCICYSKVFNQGAPPPPCALTRASESSRVRHLVNPSAMMQAPVPSVAVIICPRTHNQDCVHLVQKAHTCVYLVQIFHKCVPIQFKSAQMCPFSFNISHMCPDTVIWTANPCKPHTYGLCPFSSKTSQMCPDTAMWTHLCGGHELSGHIFNNVELSGHILMSRTIGTHL
jgi:hypothetical protein